jgi:hypothetical protein
VTERQAERGLARRPHHPREAEGSGRVEDVEVHRDVGVKRDRRGGPARGRDVRQVHHGVDTAQDFGRLAVVGEVRGQDARRHVVAAERDVGRHHVVAVLAQVQDGRQARLAGRARDTDSP